LPLFDGEQPQRRTVRFRTLGCYPLTGAVESTATTVGDVIVELSRSRHAERRGRAIDRDERASMES
jgi:sulfate adenylyltransferase subunit 2